MKKFGPEIGSKTSENRTANVMTSKSLSWSEKSKMDDNKYDPTAIHRSRSIPNQWERNTSIAKKVADAAASTGPTTASSTPIKDKLSEASKTPQASPIMRTRFPVPTSTSVENKDHMFSAWQHHSHTQSMKSSYSNINQLQAKQIAPNAWDNRGQFSQPGMDRSVSVPLSKSSQTSPVPEPRTFNTLISPDATPRSAPTPDFALEGDHTSSGSGDLTHISGTSRQTSRSLDDIDRAKLNKLMYERSVPLSEIHDRKRRHPKYGKDLALLERSMSILPDANDTDRPKQYVPRNPYRTPISFPKIPPAIFDTTEIFRKFSVDTLFFIFYFQQGTQHQYLAARELKRLSWRFTVTTHVATIR
mmetsp:Transcript_5075/g.9345  ORF Transcript_5075/g.9345 Transcript_5075/m.9345 type:complete len:359 (+) Transcript_5075:1117-2193(+)